MNTEHTHSDNMQFLVRIPKGNLGQNNINLSHFGLNLRLFASIRKKVLNRDQNGLNFMLFWPKFLLRIRALRTGKNISLSVQVTDIPTRVFNMSDPEYPEYSVHC